MDVQDIQDLDQGESQSEGQLLIHDSSSILENEKSRSNLHRVVKSRPSLAGQQNSPRLNKLSVLLTNSLFIPNPNNSDTDLLSNPLIRTSSEGELRPPKLLLEEVILSLEIQHSKIDALQKKVKATERLQQRMWVGLVILLGGLLLWPVKGIIRKLQKRQRSTN